jgi:hypothetical protein
MCTQVCVHKYVYVCDVDCVHDVQSDRADADLKLSVESTLVRQVKQFFVYAYSKHHSMFVQQRFGDWPESMHDFLLSICIQGDTGYSSCKSLG